MCSSSLTRSLLTCISSVSKGHLNKPSTEAMVAQVLWRVTAVQEKKDTVGGCGLYIQHWPSIFHFHLSWYRFFQQIPDLCRIRIIAWEYISRKWHAF